MQKGKIDIFYGPCWGDEGKGKIVDSALYKRGQEGNQYKAVVRFQGGPNAGHTLYRAGVKCVLHQIPSAVFYPDVLLVSSSGVVIDPILYVSEVAEIQENFSIDVAPRLRISHRAKLISPLAPLLDRAEESRRTGVRGDTNKVGATGKGIGVAYASDRARTGMRLGDILAPDFMEKFETLFAFEKMHLAFHVEKFAYEYNEEEIAIRKQKWLEAIEVMRAYMIGDVEHEVRTILREGGDVLAEGAQGSMLDIDHGDYPYVTSSSTLPQEILLSLGVGPEYIGERIAIMKWYNTKVGGGAFPSRMDAELEKKFQEAGGEFGATTGRPRMCGWLDLAVLRYVFDLSSPTKVVVTKADICAVDEVGIATGYTEYADGSFPYALADVQDVAVEKMPGWPGWNPKESPELPPALRAYLERLEAFFQTCDSKPLLYAVSIGPEHEDMYYWKN